MSEPLFAAEWPADAIPKGQKPLVFIANELVAIMEHAEMPEHLDGQVDNAKKFTIEIRTSEE